MSESVPLHIIHLEQDDPKKCTARKLGSRNLAILHNHSSKPPRRGFLLNPLSGIVLGPDDIPLIKKGASIVALDCSWKRLQVSIDSVNEKSPHLQGRTLPILLAANPVSWGKPGRLSTAEALAACLVLLRCDEQAREIMAPFSWGSRFFELNQQPLDAYQSAQSRKEIIEMQWEFFDEPDEFI